MNNLQVTKPAEPRPASAQSAIRSISGKSLSLSSMPFEDAERLCTFLAQSKLVPKALQNSPADIYIVLGMGEELGIPPMTALQNIGVVGGKPMAYGPIVLGLVIGHPDYVTSEEGFCETTQSGWFTIVRKNHKPYTVRFSMEDAKRHGLLGKDNWQKDPKLMCIYRAKGRALNAVFGDVLKGVCTISQYSDMEDTAEIMAALSGPPTVERVIQLVNDATTRAELEGARDLGKQLTETDRQNPALREAFTRKAAALITIDGAEQRIPAEQAA